MNLLEVRREIATQHVCGDGPISCAACIAFGYLNDLDAGRTADEMEAHTRQLWVIGAREKLER
jgi:hypothetical protein